MSKRVITFAFKSGVPKKRQQEVLTEISGWEQVDQAAHLKADAKRESFLRLCYAYVRDDADAKKVAERLTEMPEIESAASPTPRRLI